MSTYEKIQKAFPGAQTPAVVAFKSPTGDSPSAQAALTRLRRLALASGGAREPIAVTWNRDRTVANVEVPLVGSGENHASMQALQKLRSQVLPASLGRVPGASWAVTGETAGTQDFNDRIKHTFPLVFAFILGLAFLLLLVAFRSIVIPLSSIVLNLLSVGAAYGVLVWIFQDGHLQGLLGFHSNGAVVTWLPLFLFAVLFGLSMDYHVFIVSRIKELRDDGHTTAEAVSRGIRGTAGTVTAAAAVMVAVFAIFASLPTLDIKELGVGLVGGRAAGRNGDPWRAVARDDEGPGRVELVPAAVARLAAARGPRGRRAAPAGRRRAGRATAAPSSVCKRPPEHGSLARELSAPATYRRLGFVLSAFVLGQIWFLVLVIGWSLCASVLITPLVIPALLGLGAIARGCGQLEAGVARSLLGADVRGPEFPRRGIGFWRYLGAMLSGPFWRAQAYLLVRWFIGVPLAIGVFACWWARSG